MARIGKYELVAVLGKGGMGEVWRARDTDIGRTVALKLLQRTTPEDLIRFRREAEAVGRLSHPNVAQLYEFSADPPYLAMQYVEGELISRPEHLAQVARAVHHAHENGILHRDLKPANILVDSSGHAYVLDFGLAREVRHDASAMSLTGDIIGTPAFISPEQARGEVHRLDARTDVYGLGATLYALLSGRPPHAGPTAYDVLRKAIEEEPARPGGGDLETICLKAMEKDPDRRYATAAEFAEDLDRWGRGEPIVARPPSTWYRLRKRIQRQPVVWALSVLLVAAVAGGATVGIVQGARAMQAQRDRAESESRTAEHRRVLGLMERGSRRLREIDDELARRTDDELLSAVREELEGQRDDCRRELDAHPEEAASLHYITGETLIILNREDEAIEEFNLALSFLESDWGRENEVHIRSRLGRAWARIGAMQDLLVAPNVHEAGRRRGRALAFLTEIEEDLTQAAQARRLPGRTLRLAEAWEAFLRAEFDRVAGIAGEEIASGGRNEDFYLLRALLPGGVGAIDAFDAAIDRHRGRPRVWYHRAAAWRHAGKPADAIADLTEAIRLDPDYVEALYARGGLRHLTGDAQGAAADYDEIIRLDPDYAEPRVNRGILVADAGDPAGAVPFYDEAIRLRPDLPEAYYNRGNARVNLGDLSGAFEDFDRAVRLGPDDAEALANRGAFRIDLGDPRGALADLDRAIDLNPGFAQAYYHRGVAWSSLGDLTRGNAEFTESLRLRPEHAQSLANRGGNYAALRDSRRALADLDEAIRIDPGLHEAWYNRGLTYSLLRDWPRADRDYTEAIRLRADAANAWNNRGNARRNMRDFEGAMADLGESLRLNPLYAEAIANRGLVHADLGDFAAAAADYAEALQVAPADWPHRSTVEAWLREAEGE